MQIETERLLLRLIERIGADKNGYWKVKKPPSGNSNDPDA